MIIVKNLSIDGYESITFDLTSKWAKTVFENDTEDTVDVEINPNVILKTSGSRYLTKLDLAGKIAYIEKSDYKEIIIS